MIVVVFGTRPEAIKLGPIVAALRAREVATHVICTGQHTTLLAGSPVETDLAGATSLQMASDGNVDRWITKANRTLMQTIAEYQPDKVVVQGDTMSAFAGALAAVDLDVPLAHVEAGVRSGNTDNPWPEEATRIEIDRLADEHYAPTTTSAANLLIEGIGLPTVRVTGNSVVSAIERYTKAAPIATPAATIVVTFHRREVQNPEDAQPLASAVATAAIMYPSVRFLWPLHPGFVRFIAHGDLAFLRGLPNVDFVEPMGYAWFIEEVAGALGVITDSGGLVEECATLGVPCVIARDVNDRPEAVEAGLATMTPPTREGVSDGIKLLINEAIPRRPMPLYGTPDSASQIALHLANGMR